MKNKNSKIRNLKLAMIIFIVIIFITAIIYLFPIMKNISTPQGKIMFKEKITNLGVGGVLLFFGLEVAQIFLVILPGEPLEVLAGMCYGTIGGTIFLIVSVFIITILIVYLVKKFGPKIVYESFSKEKIEKIQKNKVFNNPKKIEYIMFILFFIPGTPKDFLTYIGGLLPIKPSRFILISTFARFPSIITSTLAGSNIIKGNWKNFFLIYVVTFLIIIVILVLINIFDKKKEAKEALDIIK